MTRDSASCFQGQAAVPMTRLVLAIFLSSVGAVLFSLSIFRLLQFFVMPSMFFALLLVGFPIGAAVIFGGLTLALCSYDLCCKPPPQPPPPLVELHRRLDAVLELPPLLRPPPELVVTFGFAATKRLSSASAVVRERRPSTMARDTSVG